MFESFRQALQDVLHRGTAPEQRRALLGHMRGTLAQTRVGLDDLRRTVERTRARVAIEQRELDTVQRRKRMAEGIGDAETVHVAERFERQHASRVEVLARKLEALENELSLTASEVQEMTDAYKRAAAGIGATGPAPSLDERAAAELDRELDPGADTSEYNAIRRSQERSAREQDASRRLEELKRRMGK